jgi:sulfatase maturation enzyme AslB (radical SAM superfamily)
MSSACCRLHSALGVRFTQAAEERTKARRSFTLASRSNNKSIQIPLNPECPEQFPHPVTIKMIQKNLLEIQRIFLWFFPLICFFSKSCYYEIHFGNKFCYQIKSFFYLYNRINVMAGNFLDLHIVDYCQLDCRHGYLNKGSGTMPLDMIKNICVDFFCTGFPLPHSNVILSGGDPLLHPEFPEVCEIVRTLNGRISLSTNGILIPRYLQLFKREDCIQISIDGDEGIHDYIRGPGSYQKSVSALIALNEKNIPHTISFTLNKQNQHCIDHIIGLCREHQAALLNFNIYQPIQDNALDPVSPAEWIHLRNYAREILGGSGILVPNTCVEEGCIGGILGISVLPDGTYWDCSRNQMVVGMYPQKIRDFLFWDQIRRKGTRDQFETCCRRFANV